jgi:hypothetical protein
MGESTLVGHGDDVVYTQGVSLHFETTTERRYVVLEANRRGTRERERANVRPCRGRARQTDGARPVSRSSPARACVERGQGTTPLCICVPHDGVQGQLGDRQDMTVRPECRLIEQAVSHLLEIPGPRGKAT